MDFHWATHTQWFSQATAADDKKNVTTKGVTSSTTFYGPIWPRLTSQSKKGFTYDPNRSSLSVKHGEGRDMAWCCMAASGTGLLNFIDAIIHDDSSRMNKEVYRNILFATYKRNDDPVQVVL